MAFDFVHRCAAVARVGKTQRAGRGSPALAAIHVLIGLPAAAIATTTATAAAVAAATAAAAAATAAESTTATATATSATETTTAVFARACFVDSQVSAIDVLTIDRLDGCATLSVIGELDETEATRASGFAIHDEGGRGDLSVFGEHFAKPIFGRGVREVSNIELDHCDTFLLAHET